MLKQASEQLNKNIQASNDFIMKFYKAGASISTPKECAESPTNDSAHPVTCVPPPSDELVAGLDTLIPQQDEKKIDEIKEKYHLKPKITEKHKYPICHLITIPSRIDPSKDNLGYMVHKMHNWFELLIKFATELFIYAICGNIEWKDRTNSTNPDPIAIRPNYHIHFSTIHTKDIHPSELKNLLRIHIKKPFHGPTHKDKEYPYREWFYVQKESDRHEPLFWSTDTEIKFSQFQSKIYSMFIEYPMTRRCFEDEENPLKRKRGEHNDWDDRYKPLRRWNAVITLRNLFSWKKIYWVIIGDKIVFISKSFKQQYYTVHDFLEYLENNAYFAYHFNLRKNEYVNILFNELPKWLPNYQYIRKDINIV